jgi:hypothetical protein
MKSMSVCAVNLEAIRRSYSDPSSFMPAIPNDAVYIAQCIMLTKLEQESYAPCRDHLATQHRLGAFHKYTSGNFLLPI